MIDERSVQMSGVVGGELPHPSGYTSWEGSSTSFQALRKDRQSAILGHFSPEEQQTIRYRQQVLSSLAYFIGKDFQIPVELNEPGNGWHWDFSENRIYIDPKDLAEKPMDYLRFVISHEGGHRRISRTEGIPMDVWQQPGFAFMMNTIEDPRTNNFVAEAYPKFRDQMQLAYELDLDFEAKAKGKAQDELGYKPRFMQAGFEYINQWFRDVRGEEDVLSPDLPEDVREVVKATIDSARDSWLRYPSRPEADKGENLIGRYAQVSYEINRDEIWPEFKKLVDEDMKDQRMQEMLKNATQGQGDESGEGGKGGLPQDLKDRLTEEEQQELESAITKALEGNEANNGKPKAIDLDSLSDSVKQKIKEYIDSLPEDVRAELEKKARAALKQYEEEINEQLQGKLSDNPGKQVERETTEGIKGDKKGKRKKDSDASKKPSLVDEYEDSEDFRRFKDQLEQAMQRDEGAYEIARREVLPIIDLLESDLREIFVARRESRWKSGFKTGKKIDIKRRMQEKAKGISVVESKAWQKRDLPSEKDYAISLLIDLSGSMRGQKIRETFRAAIVLAEALNRLSIRTEVLGFNDKLYEYQPFGEDMSQDVRDKMGGIPQEVFSSGAQWNDDGWAVKQASDRLAKQKEAEKFLFVLSDGVPEPSPAHSGSKYDLNTVVQDTIQNTDQKLIGLGIGPNTSHVAGYYPNSISDINIREMAERLADIVRETIANYDSF